MEEDKTRFTFSFFDAAHTDGYVAPAARIKTELSRSGNQASSRQGGGGFFSDEEQDEDIMTKIQNWQQNSGNESKKRNEKHRELHDLFSESTKKEKSQSESDNEIPTASDVIQLSRLIDDYMLGEKGDRIMQQMEDLTTDDPSSPRRNGNQTHQKDLLGGTHNPDTDKQEPSLDLDAMLSMEDFEKYIAEN